MVSQRLINYIKEDLKGHDKEEIKKILVEQGYPEELADNAIKIAVKVNEQEKEAKRGEEEKEKQGIKELEEERESRKEQLKIKAEESKEKIEELKKKTVEKARKNSKILILMFIIIILGASFFVFNDKMWILGREWKGINSNVVWFENPIPNGTVINEKYFDIEFGYNFSGYKEDYYLYLITIILYKSANEKDEYSRTFYRMVGSFGNCDFNSLLENYNCCLGLCDFEGCLDKMNNSFANTIRSYVEGDFEVFYRLRFVLINKTDEEDELEFFTEYRSLIFNGSYVTPKPNILNENDSIVNNNTYNLKWEYLGDFDSRYAYIVTSNLEKYIEGDWVEIYNINLIRDINNNVSIDEYVLNFEEGTGNYRIKLGLDLWDNDGFYDWHIITNTNSEWHYFTILGLPE